LANEAAYTSHEGNFGGEISSSDHVEKAPGSDGGPGGVYGDVEGSGCSLAGDEVDGGGVGWGVDHVSGGSCVGVEFLGS